jgi:hypothetical protein
LIAPERSEAIANSFWDTKADAEAYDHTAYAEVLKTLSNVIDGTPTVKTSSSPIQRSTRPAAPS